MKKIIGMFAVLVLVSCSDQYMVEKATYNIIQAN